MNLSSISGPGLLLTATLAIASAVGAAADPPPSADTLPTWAFVPTPPGGAAAAHEAAVDDVPRHLPGSHQSFTTRQIDDLYQVADWHPDQHPPLPQIVAKGRRPELFACAYCHLPDGLGRPENAALAGLSEAYIVEQLTEFGS
jgi:cytochrome c553